MLDVVVTITLLETQGLQKHQASLGSMGKACLENRTTETNNHTKGLNARQVKEIRY
jgi:hypothetical protein